MESNAQRSGAVHGLANDLSAGGLLAASCQKQGEGTWFWQFRINKLQDSSLLSFWHVLTWHPAGKIHVTCMCGWPSLSQRVQITSSHWGCLRVNCGHIFANTVDIQFREAPRICSVVSFILCLLGIIIFYLFFFVSVFYYISFPKKWLLNNIKITHINPALCYLAIERDTQQEQIVCFRIQHVSSATGARKTM